VPPVEDRLHNVGGSALGSRAKKAVREVILGKYWPSEMPARGDRGAGCPTRFQSAPDGGRWGRGPYQRRALGVTRRTATSASTSTLTVLGHTLTLVRSAQAPGQARGGHGYSYDGLDKIDVTYLLADGGEINQTIACITGSVISEHHVGPQMITYKVQHLGEQIQQVSSKMFMKKEDWKYVKLSDQPVQSIAQDADTKLATTKFADKKEE
jgi:hypothetical protein